MDSKHTREKFLDFFKKKGHKQVPSSSLLPSDPSVLFTTAGMQQFSPYLSGEKDILKDFGTRHLASCQKCFRSDDIEEIGDDTHQTFFEMLGNWSIGQNEKGEYFKEGAIKFALEFLVDVLGLDKNRLYVTIFKGTPPVAGQGKNISKDERSKKIWLENGIAEEKIKEFGIEDNLWGPVGKTGPCGPCSEIHYDRGREFGCNRKDCGPNCPYCERVAEIWNLVFMEYYKDSDGNYQPLPQKNVDTGIGFERILAILQKKPSAYETDIFWPIIQEIEKLSSERYTLNPKPHRIIADHIRGSVFLISEEIVPSNVGQGYVLRRLLRRAIRYGKVLGLKKEFLCAPAQKVIEIYQDVYPELLSRQADILTVIRKEEEKFEKTLEKGLKEFNKWYRRPVAGFVESDEDEIILKEKAKRELRIMPGFIAFRLFTTYGFPIELTKEIAIEKKIKVDEDGFKEELKKHQEISRAGAEKKFGGVGKEASYEATKLHTATHLLHSALRQVLGKHVKQMGSDITPQRLRFDFSHPQRMTKEEVEKVEELVNQKIKQDLEVKKEELAYEEAIKSGALAFFKEKYPVLVSVYTMGDFSKEICAGPHIKKTSELGQFKIIKEESSGAGIRRIKATLK